MGYSRVFKAATFIAVLVFAWTLLTYTPRRGISRNVDPSRLADLANDCTQRLLEDPTDTGAWRDLASTFSSHDDPERAAKKWIRRAPATLIEDYPGAALAWYWLGWTISPNDRPTRSIARSLSSEPDTVDLRVWEQADKEFDAFFSENPAVATPLLLMRHGRTLERLGRHERAAVVFDRTEQLVEKRLEAGDPTWEEMYALNAVGHGWNEMGNRERADRAWERVATMPDSGDDPMVSPRNWVNYGATYREAGSERAAQLCFERAVVLQERIAKDEPSPVALYNLAYCQAHAGDCEGALESLTESVNLGWDNRGRLIGEDAFDCLREDPRYLALIERVAANETFDGRRDDHNRP